MNKSCVVCKEDKSLNDFKGYKNSSSEILLGCSIPNYKIYLERQFEKGMTWKNHGKWHIDHIRPCASFDLTRESEQLKCFNYKNTQPLWAIDNLIKNDKYEEIKQ